MGSSSVSNSSSNTNYSNLPITQSDLTNPITTANTSGTQAGGMGNVNGSLSRNDSLNLSGNAQVNSLDGGSINAAFNFANNALLAIASQTKAFNEQTSAVNSAAIGLSGQTLTNTAAATTQAAETTTQANKNYLLIGLAVLAAGYFYFKANK